MVKIALCATLVMSATMLAPIGQRSLVNNNVPTGDLLGSVRVKCTQARSSDVGNVTEINVGGSGNSDWSGTGVYLRMKNYTATTTPITFKLNSTNGTIIAPTTGVNQTYFDKDGNSVTGEVARGWGNYLMLPANFDGFIYLNYTTQMTKIQGTADFTSNSIWRLYLEYSGSYDSYADFAIGDIFTDTKSVLDTSELSTEAFNSTFINQASAYQTHTQNARAEEDTFIPDGDLRGGVEATQSGYGGFMVKFDDLKDFSGGVYARVQNLSNTESWVMVHAASDWFANRAVTKNDASMYLFDANGSNKQTISINNVGYFGLPANFDGFIGIPASSFSGDTGWSGSAYNPATTNAIYFEASELHIKVGDVLSKDAVGYDGSEYYENQFTNHYETWSGCALTILEGFKLPEIVLFDYSQITYGGSVENGVQISTKKNEDNSVFSSVTATLDAPIDLSSGEAITLNTKAIGTYAFQLEIIDSDGNVMCMPTKADAARKPIYFISNGVATAMNNANGDENTIKCVEGEGVIVAEKSFLVQKTGTTFNYGSVAGFRVSVHTFYDSDFNASFGDIGTVDQSSLTHTIVYSSSEHEYRNTYSSSDEYLKIKVVYTPVPSTWFGDVKLIDSLNYKDDETLKENITYNEGDNACTYSKENDGMFVHIGPYEVGHQYGSYMALGMFDKGKTTDRKVASRVVDGNKEYAKGLTFYCENRSVKEIGINLQFDEKTSGVAERWIVKEYPAMYYAYDTEKDTDYMMYSKSDQIQIPVGFKGYIRIPFTSYSVPDWNLGQAGVDGELNLDNFTGDLFLTSDNTRFEDLEFFIKNIGMYFNETQKGNFISSANTIKANMGL